MSATIDFGIDLGTTNSSIALCRRGEVRLFQSAELMNVTPSVVYVSKTGRMLIGRKAYDTWVQDPQNTQAEFKRWMGYNDKLRFPASGRELSAEELSAEVLKSLRADAERQTQEQITAAVITVPAAFGSMQCDATGRAAQLAGIEQAPLLQEPIAAAIAYGASPASRDQRWMVFDLGGGTLDIAVISTRDGRLAVLEHQGNNRLGGKDIDRLIAEQLLLSRLATEIRLPDEQSNPQARNRLMRALLRQAEHAKIELSTAEQAVVDLFDLGEDADGKLIELSITLHRDEMEKRIAPVLDQCLELARRALEGARLSAADLDRVLLVGGPTQMPVVRSALQSALGAKLDYSLDPMTVVSHGAALYASTLDKVGAAAAATTTAPKSSGPSAARIELAYERASGTRQSPVAGIVDPSSGIHEINVDAPGGFWTSGWVPVVDGAFQLDVMLHESRPVTNFLLLARDRKGNPVAIEPAEFTITYMLAMAAPPLPHTIAIELSSQHGVVTFDPVFKRHTPLPAEARKNYMADRTLRPSELGSTLPIKFWEIEVSDDPQERWWAGCVHLQSDRIKRPILEGTEMELIVRIDASRKMSVELFIPLLNQSFTDNVYIPDPPGTRSQLQQQIDLCFERLQHIREVMYAGDHGELAPMLEELELQAESIAEAANKHSRSDSADPDASLASNIELRKLRLQLTRMEEQLNIGSMALTLERKLRWQVRYVGRVTAVHGTASELAEFQKLESQYHRYLESGDARGLKWIYEQIWSLHYLIVKDQMWHWQNWLAELKSPASRFVNREEALKAIAEAEAANACGDLPALRSACNRALALRPNDSLQAAREQISQSGIRAT